MPWKQAIIDVQILFAVILKPQDELEREELLQPGFYSKCGRDDLTGGRS
jgi:hypothetical protein